MNYNRSLWGCVGRPDSLPNRPQPRSYPAPAQVRAVSQHSVCSSGKGEVGLPWPGGNGVGWKCQELPESNSAMFCHAGELLEITSWTLTPWTRIWKMKHARYSRGLTNHHQNDGENVPNTQAVSAILSSGTNLEK